MNVVQEKKEPLYIQLYQYYKALILDGILKAEDKLPSIRRCSEEWGLSRTTVETAYFQLVSEGYVTAMPGSGYFVCALDYEVINTIEKQIYTEEIVKRDIKYDFKTTNVDRDSFNFEPWRRYVKSALRNTERLITYGEPQGEYDLRVELAGYVREKRGVMCTAEQIVVGAGMQTLLHIVCTLINQQNGALFIGNSYEQGKVVLEDRGIYVEEHTSLDEKKLQEESCKLIYVSPSHYTSSGKVMPMKERLKLLAYAKEHKGFIIEDDYDSDFNYTNRPIPSLQGLDGGNRVIYMSTFSKVLLPSLRMSFMVLPKELVGQYRKKCMYYSQTTSKVEQIALCQFIRDGNMEKQIKKSRKLYINKKQQFKESIMEKCKGLVKVEAGESGFFVRLVFKSTKEPQEIKQALLIKGMAVKAVEKDDKKGVISILLSCSSEKKEVFDIGAKILKEVIMN